MFSNSFFIISLLFNVEIDDQRKYLSSFFIFGFLVAPLCNNYSGDFMYDPPLFNPLDKHFQMQNRFLYLFSTFLDNHVKKTRKVL